MPVRKFTFDASDLENWADKTSAWTQLPGIVRQMVLETVPEVHRIRMPSGSSVNRPGWDGYLEVERANPWVSEGTSVWEFSCRTDIRAKATEDYDNRTPDPPGVDARSSTFVFVTARRWGEGDKGKWITDRLQEGEWHDIRVLDADDLVAWLEQAPQAAESLARLMYGIVFQIVESRLEHTTAVNAVAADISEIKSTLLSISTSSISHVDELDSEQARDPIHRELEEGIDEVRNLIDQGLVLSARGKLENIRADAGEIPEHLILRILTNLAACELEIGNIDAACELLEEAHSQLPENQTAIANAALAAGLRKDFPLSVELAREALALEPHDSQATAALMGGLWETRELEQLDRVVDTEEWIAGDRRCSLLLATIRMHQSRFEEATTLFRSLNETNPKDAEGHLALSQCLIQRYQADSLALGYGAKSPEWLLEAESEATLSIELLETTQLQTRRHQARVARAAARILMGNDEAGSADLNVVLGESPRQSDAAYNKGLMLLNQGRHEEARVVLESIEDTEIQENAILPLAEVCLALGDAKAVVVLLSGKINLGDPSWENLRMAEQLLEAEALLGCESSVSLALEPALNQDPNNHRLLLLEAMRLKSQNDGVGAEIALRRAVENAAGPDRRAIQFQLGAFYESVGKFREAADLIGEVVGDNASHPAAIPLLRCLFRGELHREALDLGRKIRQTDPVPPRLALEVEAWVLEYVGDIPSMISRLEDIGSRSDSTSLDKFALAFAHFRCGSHDVAREVILAIDISELSNDPHSLMELAKMKRLLGMEGFLNDAYLARRCGYDNATVHLGYFGLFQSRSEEWEEPEVVGPGCAVLLKDGSQENWWHIVDAREEPRGSHELTAEHETAQRLIGSRVGATIYLREGIEVLSYEIMAIQSKFARAFQEVSEEFSTLFPEHPGLFRVPVENVHQVIDERGQYVRSVEDLYKTGQIPLVTFASMVGRSVTEVWRGLTNSPSARVHFGTGTHIDTSEAAELLNDAECLILDSVSLLTVHELRLIGHVQERFDRVVISHPGFDEIQNMVHSIMMTGRPSGSMGLDEGGRRTISDISDIAWAEWEAYVYSVLELAESLERMPMYPLLDADRYEDLSLALTRAGVGAVYAGEEGGGVNSFLLSDDIALSKFASAEGMNVVNTQTLLLGLLGSKHITESQYSSYIERLALLNYSIVVCGPEDVLRRLEASSYMTTEGTRAMLETLENPDLDVNALVSFGAEIVSSLATRKDAPPHEAILILFMVLTHLWRGRRSIQILRDFRSEVRSALNLAPPLQSQMLPLIDDYIQVHMGPNP